MPRCQGWSEDSDSDSWPISDVRLHARSLKTSCHPCSAIPIVCTLVQSFTYLTELYSNMLNWGEGNGNPLQYSCPENPRDRAAWWAAVYGVAQSRTWLKRLSSSSSRSYGFYSSHVRMWELDHKEIWALKDWCFWSVVLEKTLESPLECEEIQPVHPKGNQSWLLSGSTDAEAQNYGHLM